MIRGELSKCHPNGGIPRQDKPSLRPLTLDTLPRTQCLAPAWKRGQLSQSLASQPPQLDNQVLRRHTHKGTTVTAWQTLCRSTGTAAGPVLSLWPPHSCL